MIKLKNILLEKKDLDSKVIKTVEKYTQMNRHTDARIILSKALKNKRLIKFYDAMYELNDVFGGYGPELSKLNQMMEKELYKDIKRNYSNAKDIIGSL